MDIYMPDAAATLRANADLKNLPSIGAVDNGCFGAVQINEASSVTYDSGAYKYTYFHSVSWIFS